MAQVCRSKVIPFAALILSIQATWLVLLLLGLSNAVGGISDILTLRDRAAYPYLFEDSRQLEPAPGDCGGADPARVEIDYACPNPLPHRTWVPFQLRVDPQQVTLMLGDHWVLTDYARESSWRLMTPPIAGWNTGRIRLFTEKGGRLALRFLNYRCLPAEDPTAIPDKAD